MDFPIRISGPEEGPLHLQLYNEYRDAILNGRLTPGQRVPSTRLLARQIGVSRTTATRAYDDLIAEGYLESAHGSGTFVCRKLPDESIIRPAGVPGSDAAPDLLCLSEYGARLASAIPMDSPPVHRTIDFHSWRPGFDSFPVELWARLLSRAARTLDVESLDYERDWLGYLPLREALAAYLSRSRAVHCTAEQILITNGSQQAFTLIARILVNPGDCVAVEDPGYTRIRQVLASEGAQILHVPVDDCGIQVSALEALPTVPKLVYVTPSHQYPTGGVLPLNRRLELVSWARENDVFLIEDDYDSEYRYAGRPFPSLQGLDQHGSVVYTGTFSKVLFPSLRLGYVVAPQPLIPVLVRAKRVADRHCSTVEQRALAAFIADGHLERHLRRTRILYDERRQALVRALTRHFGTKVVIKGENAGIHILVRLNTPLDDDDVLFRAENAGITIATAKPYYSGTSPRGEFLMGYANLEPAKIEEGVQRLAEALNSKPLAMHARD